MLEKLPQSGIRLLRRPEVERRVGLKHTMLDAAISRGEFPKPVLITPGGRAVGWPEYEVDAFLRARIAARDAAEEGG